MKQILAAAAALTLAACATTRSRTDSVQEVPAAPAQAEAESAPEAAEPAAPAAEPAACTLSRVHFAFDSALLEQSAREHLSETAHCISQGKIPAVVIEGHADERGTEAYNIALGQRRAESVRGYLKKLGVGAKMKVVSYGEAYPLTQAEGEQAWQENRRAELRSPGEQLSDGASVVPGT